MLALACRVNHQWRPSHGHSPKRKGHTAADPSLARRAALTPPLGQGYAMFCAERISPLLPPRVMPVDPVPVTVVPTPVSRKPHVVHWTHVISRAVGIIRSIANLYENPDSTRARRKNAARTE